jgi:hypothetical protein
MEAEGGMPAMAGSASCNHDNCVCCKAPSAAFHLDLGSYDPLLLETFRNDCKYTKKVYCYDR